jgi:hypothetical protein
VPGRRARLRLAGGELIPVGGGAPWRWGGGRPRVPFALAGAEGPGTAPLWSSQDPGKPSLQITAFAVAMAHRVASFDPAVAGHPWLVRATDHCLEEIAATRECPFPLVLRYLIWVLDSLPADDRPAGELERLVDFIPADLTMPVPGGTEDEAMLPLDFSPRSDGALRDLVDPAVIEGDLDRLLAEADVDGGWDVDWASWSPAGAVEWRGWATVRAIRILLDHGRLSAAPVQGDHGPTQRGDR